MQPALNAFTEQPADTAEATSRAGLEQAFALFNRMSSQLSESYSLLEERVTELKGQLALVSAQRMEELAERSAWRTACRACSTCFPAASSSSMPMAWSARPTRRPWACLASRWWACSGVR